MLQNGALHVNSADPAEHPAPTGLRPVVKQGGRKCLIEHSKSAGLILFLNKSTQRCFCFFSACSGMFESELTRSPVQANLCTSPYGLRGNRGHCRFRVLLPLREGPSNTHNKLTGEWRGSRSYFFFFFLLFSFSWTNHGVM